MAKCSICGKEYVPNRSSKQKLCGSQVCKRENKRRVRAKREGYKLTDRTPRPCVVCGQLYIPHQSNQTTCQEFACKAEGRKLAAIRRYHAKRDADAETCPICNRKYVPKYDGQKTCGGSRCVYALRIQNAPKETRACKYCRTEFQTTPNSGRVFCQDDCRENWNDEQRLIAKREQIECPFGGMQTMIPGLPTWDCPEMDPMSGGFPMRTFNAPMAREVAA